MSTQPRREIRLRDGRALAFNEYGRGDGTHHLVSWRAELARRRRLDHQVELASELEVDRFVVVGSSGGAAYALAYGVALPETDRQSARPRGRWQFTSRRRNP